MQFKEIHRKFPFKSTGVGTRTHRRLVGAGRRADLGSTVLRPTQEAEAAGLLIQQTHAESRVRVWSRGPRSITTGDGCTWCRGSRLLSAAAAGAGISRRGVHCAGEVGEGCTPPRSPAEMEEPGAPVKVAKTSWRNR